MPTSMKNVQPMSASILWFLISTDRGVFGALIEFPSLQNKNPPSQFWKAAGWGWFSSGQKDLNLHRPFRLLRYPRPRRAQHMASLWWISWGFIVFFFWGGGTLFGLMSKKSYVFFWGGNFLLQDFVCKLRKLVVCADDEVEHQKAHASKGPFRKQKGKGIQYLDFSKDGTS